MRFRIATIAMGLLLASTFLVPQAEAARSDARSEARSSQSQPSRGAARNTRQTRARAGGGGGISCVPYARSITGMQISGNGGEWWNNSAGRYARGQRPQIGSVLSFRSSGGMRLGHVAVVSRIVQPRVLEIDHANWGGPGIRRGTVMRNVRVIDVSDDNTWTRVRVQVGWTSENFGREYPTDGFIHNRPAGSFVAGVDDAMRPVTYSTRTEITHRPARRTPRHAAQPARSSQTAARAPARQGRQPVRVAQARLSR